MKNRITYELKIRLVFMNLLPNVTYQFRWVLICFLRSNLVNLNYWSLGLWAWSRVDEGGWDVDEVFHSQVDILAHLLLDAKWKSRITLSVDRLFLPCVLHFQSYSNSITCLPCHSFIPSPTFIPSYSFSLLCFYVSNLPIYYRYIVIVQSLLILSF